MCADVDFRIILSAGMSKAKEAGTPGDLDRREWYFENDELSDDELRASHAHEYGREIAKRSRYVLTQLKILWLANELPKKHQQRGPDLSGATISHPRLPPKIKRHPARIRGDEAAFKLRDFGIPVDSLGVRGSEKENWYDLPETVRNNAVRAIRDRLQRKRRAAGLSVVMRTFSDLHNSGSRAFIDVLWLEFLREFHLIWLGGENVERGFFAIDWDADLAALKKQTFNWVKERHAERKNRARIRQARPSRGKLRDQLRWLGALRCKEHYGRKHLSTGNLQKIEVPAPYKSVPDLYHNAKKAKKILDDRITEIMQPKPWLN